MKIINRIHVRIKVLNSVKAAMRRLGNCNPDLAVIHYLGPDLTFEKKRIGGIGHIPVRYKKPTIVPEPFVMGATK